MELGSAFHTKRGRSYGVEHLLASQAGPLSDILFESLRLEPKRSQFLLSLGAIYLQQQRLPADFSAPIEKGSYLRVHQNPRRFPVELFKSRQALVFENLDLLIIDKPSGLPVHPTVDNARENIWALLQSQRGQPLFVTHRLDVATCGLLVFAKSKQAQSEFNQLLMQGLVQKKYRTQVHGENVPLGLMTHYMEPSPRAPKKVTALPVAGWSECRLQVLTAEKEENKSLLTIELLTGRTHQIRAQLAACGFPIVGDTAYGSPESGGAFEQIRLQAFSLSFTWKSQRQNFCLPPPETLV